MHAVSKEWWRLLVTVSILSMSTSAVLAQNPRLQQNASEVAQSSILDQQLVVVHRRTAETDEMVQQVYKALALLPDTVKQNFRDNGVTVVVTPTMSELTGGRGGACYQIEAKRVVIPVWNDLTNSPIPKQMIGRVVLLHELGHAYDHTNGRISLRPEFLGIYNAEESKVPADKRKLLAYFLEGQEESSAEIRPHRPPQECFASLFASKYARGNLPRLATLRECFPKAAAFVANLRP